MSREGSPDQFKPKRTAAQGRIYDMEGVIDAAAKTKSEQVPQPEDAREPGDESVEFAEKDVGDIKNGDEALKKPNEAVKGFASLETVEGSTAITTAGEDNAKVEATYQATKVPLPEVREEAVGVVRESDQLNAVDRHGAQETAQFKKELQDLRINILGIIGEIYARYPDIQNHSFEVSAYLKQLAELQENIQKQEDMITDRPSALVTDVSLRASYAKLPAFIKDTDLAIASIRNAPALEVVSPTQTAEDQWSQATKPQMIHAASDEQAQSAVEVSAEAIAVGNDEAAEQTLGFVNQFREEADEESKILKKPATLVLSEDQRVPATDPLPVPTKSRFTPATVESKEQPKKTLSSRDRFQILKNVFGLGTSSEQARPPGSDPSIARIGRPLKRVMTPTESESKDKEPVLTGSNSLDWLQRLHGQELGADIYRSKQVLHRLRNQDTTTTSSQAERSSVEQPGQVVAPDRSEVNVFNDKNQELRAELARYNQDSLEPDLLPEVDELGDEASVESQVDNLAPKLVSKAVESKRSPTSEIKTEYEAMNAAWDDVLETETELDITVPETTERAEELIQAKVTQIERADENSIDSLSNGYQSPYKILGDKSFQEIAQWVASGESVLQANLNQYQIKKEVFKRWQQLFPELQKQAEGTVNKSFKTVVDEFLLAQKSI